MCARLHPCLVAVFFSLAGVFTQPLRAQTAPDIGKPVIRLEEAMRVWQERWITISGAGEPLGAGNPNRARAGASTDSGTGQNIFNAPLTWPARGIDGQRPPPFPPDCFYAEDLKKNNLTASRVIAFRAAITTSLGATVGSGPNDIGGLILRFDPQWQNLSTPYGSGGPLTTPSGASRMVKVLYNGSWVFPDPSVAPWNTILGGSITINNYEQRFQDLVNFLKLPMHLNTFWTQVGNDSDGIEWDWKNHFISPDIYTSDCPSCITCTTSVCILGRTTAANNSIDLSITLGSGADGPLGSLKIYAETPSATLATPAALQLSLGGRVYNTTSAGGQLPNPSEAYAILDPSTQLLQEVRLPQGRVEVVPDAGSPSYGYTLEFYDLSSALYRTVRVENPDGAASNNRLRVTETKGAATWISEWTYNPATLGWTLATGTGDEARTDVITKTWTTGSGNAVGNILTEVREVRNSANVLVMKERKRFKIFHWNTTDAAGTIPIIVGQPGNRQRRYELIEHTLDPDGKNLTTTYRYDESFNSNYQANQTIKRLRQIERWDGTWERFDYDTGATGKVIRTYSSFNNSAAPAFNPLSITTPTGDYRLIERSVASSPETTTETLRINSVDTIVSRRFVTRDFNTLNPYDQVTEEVATSASATSAGDATHLKTITRTVRLGIFQGRPSRTVRPDGTVTIHTYLHDAFTGETTHTVNDGVPNNSDPLAATGVTEGTRVVTLTSAQGQVISSDTYDIAASVATLTDSTTSADPDDFGRFETTLHLDGTIATRVFGCCGLASSTDRAGLRTVYDYDSLRRLKRATTYLGNSTEKYSDVEYRYDAADRPTHTIRHAHGASLDATVPASITTETNGYNPAGQRISVTTPTSATATLIDTTVVSGQRQVTTTYPDASTRIELHDRAGRLASITGTAAFPVNYTYGVDATGSFTQEIRVGEGGALTEWTKTYADFAGRPGPVVQADGATTSRSYYAANDTVAGRRGKLKSVTQPPDSTSGGAVGVQVLTDYNAEGEAEVSALDMNQNGVIDYAGLDRITKTVRDVVTVNKSGTNYITRRTTTSVWAADNSNTPSEVSTTWESVNGLRTWTSSYGLPDAKSVTAYLGNGTRTDTDTASDGTVTVQTTVGARLQSTVTTSPDAGNAQLGRVDYLYDGHGRLERSTDARNGSTTFTYFNHDRQKSVLTTDPVLGQSGSGLDAQLTSTVYDDLGRPFTITLPDSGLVQRRYHPTGLLYRTWGKRTQPEESTYDPQGRLKTLSTWQQFTGESSFAGTTGKATTTWNYHPQRGWLASKVYPDATTGLAAPASAVSYLRYPSGQLRQRTWARTPTVTTDYTYNLAGQLAGIDYSDTTPDLTAVQYDRLGRRISATDAAGTVTTGYTGLTALLEDESYSGGVLDGLALARTPDSLLRPDVLTVSAASYTAGMSYKDGSRPDTLTATVGGVTTSHAYVYQANSALIDTLTQKRGANTVLTTTKTFDRLNRLGTIAAAPPSAPNVSTAWTYNDANQRTKATEASGEYWDYGYDDLGQVTGGVKKLATATPVPGHAFGYTFDQAGNLTATTTNGQAAIYTPDRLNRYAERTVPAFIDVLGSAEPTAQVFVNLLPATRQGALFHRQLAVSNSAAPAYPALSILAAKPGAGIAGADAIVKTTGNAYLPQSPEDFDQDLDGNLTLDGGWIYTWDAENRVRNATRSPAAYGVGAPRIQLGFVYDSQNRRVQKTVSTWNGSAYVPQTTTRYLYDGWNLVAEFNGTTPLRTYVWGLDLSGSMQGAGGVGGLLQITDSTGTPASYFPVYSGNGDVIGLYDTATAQRSANYVYGPFGELIGAYGPAAGVQPFRFSTKYEDAETGLLNYGYRVYSPSLKRFLNRDPIEEQGGVNLYAIVGNSLVNRWDYLGMSWEDPHNNSLLNQARVLMNSESNLDRLKAIPYGIGGSAVGVWDAGFNIFRYQLPEGVARNKAELATRDPATALIGRAYLSTLEIGSSPFSLLYNIDRVPGGLMNLPSALVDDFDRMVECPSVSSFYDLSEKLAAIYGISRFAAQRTIAAQMAYRRSIAQDFYKSNTTWTDARIQSHLRGIDFSKPVRVEVLPSRTELLQYHLPNQAPGNYFTLPGAPANQLGIYTSGLTETPRFLIGPTRALSSTAASIVDDWSMPADSGWKIQVDGGGPQFFVPPRASP